MIHWKVIMMMMWRRWSRMFYYAAMIWITNKFFFITNNKVVRYVHIINFLIWYYFLQKYRTLVWDYLIIILKNWCSLLLYPKTASIWLEALNMVGTQKPLDVYVSDIQFEIYWNIVTYYLERYSGTDMLSVSQTSDSKAAHKNILEMLS